MNGTVDYETLVYRLGSLYTMLREMAEAGLFQGEHTIAYQAGGVERTLHIYIEGTDLQMSETPGNSTGLDISLNLE